MSIHTGIIASACTRSFFVRALSARALESPGTLFSVCRPVLSLTRDWNGGFYSPGAPFHVSCWATKSPKFAHLLTSNYFFFSCLPLSLFVCAFLSPVHAGVCTSASVCPPACLSGLHNMRGGSCNIYWPIPLSQLEDASLILHVVDSASPLARQQVWSVQSIIEELMVEDTPQVMVLNKCDKRSVHSRSSLNFVACMHTQSMLARTKHACVWSCIQDMQENIHTYVRACAHICVHMCKNTMKWCVRVLVCVCERQKERTDMCICV